jgi:hypothetical protein
VRLVLEDINSGVSDGQAARAKAGREFYHDRLARLWTEWNAMQAPRRS